MRLGTGETSVARAVVDRFKSGVIGPEHMDRFLRSASNFMIAALKSDEPVGFLLAYALERVDEPHAKLFIYEIEVAPEHRRLGVGTALIRHALEWVEKERMLGAFVLTNHANHEAVAFFKHTGATVATGDDLMLTYSGGE